MNIDPKISVIIPTKNRADMLTRFLPTLAEQTTQEPYEIIIVDNGSTDSTRQTVNEFSRRWTFIRLIEELNPGSASACHAGAVAARSPLIMFVDDDMEAVPELIEQHLAAHKQNPGVCVLGQILSAQGKHPFERMLAYIFDGPRKTLGNREPEASDYWSGNVSMPRELYLGLGGYDQVFAKLGYGKDIDFGKRLLESGGKMVFVPEAVTYHNFSERFGERLRKGYRAGIAYGYVKENYPNMPVPEIDNADGKLNPKTVEWLCRLAAAIMEPFDRGTGVPIKPLAYVYDLGLRSAVSSGLMDYNADKATIDGQRQKA